MNEDEKYGFSHLIEKEISSGDKIMKPDFSQKSGRELLAFYLQSKFKQILSFDSKLETPIITNVKHDFIQKFLSRLIQNPTKRIMIAITGESASGKSTICNTIKQIVNTYNMPVSIISTDNYFNDISDLIKKYGTFDALRDNGYDVDSPESFQMDVLKSDLEKISDGQDIYIPKYLPNGTGVSVPKANFIPSNKIVVIEGMASMYVDNSDIYDIKLYVETETETRKKWFLNRACTERNQDMENALKHWAYITEAGQKYIIPYKSEADIIINGASNLKYFAQILEYIYTITNNFDC